MNCPSLLERAFCRVQKEQVQDKNSKPIRRGAEKSTGTGPRLSEFVWLLVAVWQFLFRLHRARQRSHQITNDDHSHHGNRNQVHVAPPPLRPLSPEPCSSHATSAFPAARWIPGAPEVVHCCSMISPALAAQIVTANITLAAAGTRAGHRSILQGTA